MLISVSDSLKHVERSLDTKQPQRSPAGRRGLIMPPKFKGPKLPKIPICQTPETVPVPENLDKHTTITINDQKFDIEADDLEVICELGKCTSHSCFCLCILQHLILECNIYNHTT